MLRQVWNLALRFPGLGPLPNPQPLSLGSEHPPHQPPPHPSLTFLEDWLGLGGVNTAQQFIAIARRGGRGTLLASPWLVSEEMDELSHFTGASKLTVNIRGNDIDFKVLWLQMSLVLSFSFSFLRKKKKTQSPSSDLHFSFLCFPVLRARKMETVPHLAPGGHPTPESLTEKSKSDVAPLCLLSQVCHA